LKHVIANLGYIVCIITDWYGTCSLWCVESDSL